MIRMFGLLAAHCTWLLLVSSASLSAQTMLKVNLPTTVLAIPGVGVERTTGLRTTLQWDLTVSPWASVNGAPLQFAMLVPEWRWHRDSTFVGPYLGLHAGLAGFRLQRWSYRNTQFFQEGFGVLGGLTLGYKRALNPTWSLDLFLGGGTMQTKYKGYRLDTGERYDGESGWNESGEWLIYRGGVMLAYRRP